MSRRGGFYEALGVAADASTETIRDAYRERVKEVHPDRSDVPDAAERFKRVTRAKEVLTDPQERARYDRLGHEAYVGRAFSSGSNDGGGEPTGRDSGPAGPGPRHRSAASRARRGRDARADATGRRRSRSPGSGAGPARGQAGEGTAGAGPEDRRADGGATSTATGRARERARSRRRRSRRETRASWESRSASDTARRGHESGRTADRARSSGHAGEHYDGDWYSPEADSGIGYDVSPGSGTGLGPERVGLAAVAFVLYPLLAAGAFAPWFPPGINVAIGLLGLLLVVALLWTPEAGVLAFGGWTVLAPAVLVATGVGVFSLAGVLVWSACWIPFLLSLLGLVFRHP